MRTLRSDRTLAVPSLKTWLPSWTAAVREAHLTARRDRPIPLPLDVSGSSHDDWNVGPEDVPVVEFNVPEVTVAHAAPVASVAPVAVVVEHRKPGRPKKVLEA